MPWALGRRIFILGVVALVIALLVGLAWYLLAYQAPSCTDGKLNQDEEEVDCGGSCPYLCDTGLIPLSVEFVRYVSPQSGRTDVIAYIENSNHFAAAREVSFTVELLNPDNALISEKEGTVDVPPSSVIPVYIPNFFSGTQEVSRVFLDIDEESFRWIPYSDERALPRVKSTNIANTATPRITAVLSNTSALPLENVRTVITVFDAKGNAIAASQTVVSVIEAQGTAEAIFTWPSPFIDTPSRVEVIPVLPF